MHGVEQQNAKMIFFFFEIHASYSQNKKFPENNTDRNSKNFGKAGEGREKTKLNN